MSKAEGSVRVPSTGRAQRNRSGGGGLVTKALSLRSSHVCKGKPRAGLERQVILVFFPKLPPAAELQREVYGGREHKQKVIPVVGGTILSSNTRVS